jgi:hypothetical protein
MMIDVTTIKKVYSGKARKCCCGCAGTYYYASAYSEGGERVSDTQVKRIVNILNNNPATVLDSNHYWVEVGNRVYVAYFA